MRKTLIIIPARLNSTRLPRKPLADILGKPMVVHVWRRAREAGIGPVHVATDSPEIADVIREAGGSAVLTSGNHQSGSDRVYEALGLLDPGGEIDAVVNLQGDLPAIEPSHIRACATALSGDAAIATLAAPCADAAEALDPNVVKVVGSPRENGLLKALYFTRAPAPYGPGPIYHHIGIYAFTRAALERFVRLPPSPLEKRERLEQLRALEAEMTIQVSLVDKAPISVDTAEDLAQARKILGQQAREGLVDIHGF